MEMDGGTMMKNINSICIKQFQERYGNMTPRDWERLIYGYIRDVPHHTSPKGYVMLPYSASFSLPIGGRSWGWLKVFF